MSKRRFKTTEEPKIEERFDYAEEVRKQIDRCVIAFSNDDGTEYSRILTKNTILALENLIPIADRDKQLEKELKKAFNVEYVDNRPIWCNLRMGKKIFIDDPDAEEERDRKVNQIPIEVINSHKYFRACFNQFVRLKVVVRRSYRAG